MKFRRKIVRAVLFPAIAAASLSGSAYEKTEEMMRMASNYYAYPYTDQPAPPLTPAPQGYTPFHIEHYGRHGSRWLIGREAYSAPVEMLEKAERNDRLTQRGKELLGQLREYAVMADGRDGELTPLGARQHQGIAKRMAANFPEVFADSARIDARSTIVIRCILSMLNEIQELKAINPRLDVATDASYADMYYMNFGDSIARAASAMGDEAYREFVEANPYPLEFVDIVFTDRAFAKDSLDCDRLFYNLARIAGNQQSHDGNVPDITDIISENEMHSFWRRTNASWFKRNGNSAVTGNLAPSSQRNLLANIIESADTALMSPGNGANLRFGHEVVVMPLAVLMELGHYGDEINDFDSLDKVWRNYEIYPMACNVQMIFYRPESSGDPDDILVKVLLNEREISLPVPAVEGPYVRWSDLRSHYVDRLREIGHVNLDKIDR